MTQKEIGPFSAKDKPVHDGVYRRLIVGEGNWAKWQHGEWKVQCDTYKQAQKEVRTSAYQTAYFEWWGIEK